MDVKLSKATEDRLAELATRSGRAVDELVEDAVAGYVAELTCVREELDRRYDDLKKGRVKPMDGEEAYARLMAKTEAQRRRAQ